MVGGFPANKVEIALHLEQAKVARLLLTKGYEGMEIFRGICRCKYYAKNFQFG